MRTILADTIRKAVRDITIESNLYLPEDVGKAIRSARERETDPLARKMLDTILQNHAAAAEDRMPLCQDTGTAVVFLEVGQEVHIEGGSLAEAVHRGVAEGYAEGYLRKSMVNHPWFRTNTGDNTPAMIHTEIVPGDRFSVTVIPKGGGAENYAALSMLSPAQGLEAAKDFIVECVRKAGPNACPPVVVGVGIGGNAEEASLLAKKALLRPLNLHSRDPETARLEEELLGRINALGIGPMGLGGDTTALGVSVETAPCHIASFPVAVNLNCHVHRHVSRML